MQTFTCSEPGGHLVNEDAFAIQPLEAGGILCVVADGQGGRSGGAQASRLACRVCMEVAVGQSAKRLLLPGTWSEIVHAADAAVLADSAAGFTTLVAFCIGHGFVCGGSNGDSAAVVVNADNSYTCLTEKQRKNPPVGSGAAAVELFSAQLMEPWKVLAMTDGVWKYASWESVARAAGEKNGNALIDSIHSAALSQRSKSLQDDFTLVVIQSEVPE